MIKILFVCLGNICRSPMAEFVMKDLVKREGLADYFYIESAGTSNEEEGNPVYPPAREEMKKHGITCEGKRARQLKKEDYDRFDSIIGMEDANLSGIARITGQKGGKITKLLSFAGQKDGIADPWYTRDFERTYREVETGCKALLNHLKNSGELR